MPRGLRSQADGYQHSSAQKLPASYQVITNRYINQVGSSEGVDNFSKQLHLKLSLAARVCAEIWYQERNEQTEKKTYYIE